MSVRLKTDRSKKSPFSDQIIMSFFWKPISKLVISQSFRKFGHSLTDRYRIKVRVWCSNRHFFTKISAIKTFIWSNIFYALHDSNIKNEKKIFLDSFMTIISVSMGCLWIKKKIFSNFCPPTPLVKWTVFLCNCMTQTKIKVDISSIIWQKFFFLFLISPRNS